MCLSLIASFRSQMDEPEGQAIVDFGGGVGMYWPAVKAQNKAGFEDTFMVVDNPENCNAGKRIFNGDPIEFHSDFEDATKGRNDIKVLNVASTLQYCLDYEHTINMLCESNAMFIVVTRHPAPDAGLPIAYAIQNVVSINGYCGQIPVVLIGVESLVRLMNERGYMLIADYFNDTDPDKYWKYAKKPVPAEYSRIIDHAIVFQRTAPLRGGLISNLP